MCGMGNLTRAAYANQRMTLIGNFAKVKRYKAEYDESRYVVIHVARFVIHVLQRAFGDALN